VAVATAAAGCGAGATGSNSTGGTTAGAACGAGPGGGVRTATTADPTSAASTATASATRTTRRGWAERGGATADPSSRGRAPARRAESANPPRPDARLTGEGGPTAPACAVATPTSRRSGGRLTGSVGESTGAGTPYPGHEPDRGGGRHGAERHGRGAEGQ